MLDARLKVQPWLATAACTIADLALYPYTRWADEAGIDLGPYAAVRRWLLDIESAPGFLPLRTCGAKAAMSFEAYLRSSCV